MQATGPIDERLTWLNFQAGDKHAYSLLYDTYFKPLYRYGLKISADADLVQDCIQELFIKLWRTKENLAQPLSTKSYLLESLKRTILKELARKQYKIQENLPEDYHFEVCLPHEFRLIDLQVTEERMQQLEKALQKLTKRQRDAIHLKFYGQLSYEEIAEIMALNIRSVYNLISKALDTLYQEINQYDSLQVMPVLLALSALSYS
jgi:RNA polymerase sigma factor (sigma-70 family)